MSLRFQIFRIIVVLRLAHGPFRACTVVTRAVHSGVLNGRLKRARIFTPLSKLTKASAVRMFIDSAFKWHPYHSTDVRCAAVPALVQGAVLLGS